MRQLSAGRHVDPRSPRGYYVDHSRLSDPRGPVDAHGLPALPSPAEGHTHSPLDVARYGLGNLELYLESGSIERRDRFERAARFLIESIEVVPSTFGGWAMPPAAGPYRELLPSGRFAAGAQGECVSALVRASQLLGVEDAMETARTAVAAFATPVADGGFLREMGESGAGVGIDSPAFLEEYPMEDRPVMDLSGHLRGLLGVHDYCQACDDRSASSLRDRCVRGLSFVLERFDLGYWTRDDLDGLRDRVNVSSMASLREHVLHMSVLAELSDDDSLRESGLRWRAYAGDPACRLRALAGRVALRLRGLLRS